MPKVTVASEISDKANSPESKKARAAQAVGKVKLNERKTFKVVKDGKHLSKGDEISVNKPMEALLRELGFIK